MYDPSLAALLRARGYVRLIEHAFGQPAKKARRPVLQDFASRTQQSRVLVQRATEREQIALIAAGAVKQEERPAASAGDEFIFKTERIH